MMLVLCLTTASGLVCGFWLGMRHIAKAPQMNLALLEERLQHARNVSMRLGELTEHQRRLTTESFNLEHHLQLRDGVAWMLLCVQHEMHHSGVALDPAESDRIERLLSSMSKSLRLLMEVGRTPVLPWREFKPVAEQLHQTLCLLCRTLPETKMPNTRSEHTGSKCFSLPLINQLINLSATNSMPESFPISPHTEGLVLHGRHDTQVRTYAWESDAF